MKYKGIIFDLDGTLLDTLEDLANSVNMILEGLGFPTHEVEKYKYFVGDGLRKIFERALPSDKRDEATIAICTASFFEIYGKNMAVKTRPYEGIPELLNELDKRNIRKAILSNKPHLATEKLVAKVLSNWKFDVVFGERPLIPKKPEPTSALEIARLLDIHPHELLYVGDTGIDMKTANAAGMYAVGVLWGFRTADEISKAGAKTMISEPLKLLNLL